MSSKIQGLSLFHTPFFNLLPWRPTGKLALTKLRELAIPHVPTDFFGLLCMSSTLEMQHSYLTKDKKRWVASFTWSRFYSCLLVCVLEL